MELTYTYSPSPIIANMWRILRGRAVALSSAETRFSDLIAAHVHMYVKQWCHGNSRRCKSASEK